MKKRTLQTFFLIIIFITVSSVNLNVFPARSSASITRVQGNARGIAKSGSSITINLADSPTEGNLLILAFGGYSASPTIIISSISQTGVSWSIQRTCTWSYRRVEIWAGVVGSGAGTTITITLSKSISNGIAIADVCEYSGLATSDFKDQTAYGYGGSQTTTSTGTTETTTQADELWVGAIFAEGTSSVAQSNPTNGFSLLDGANEGYTYGGASLAYLEKIVSSTGQASSGTTLANKPNYYVGCIVTFKAKIETVSIGGFEAPSVVYPDSYFLMNTTIVACNDVSEFVNATVELENGIILMWDAATDTFSEYQDTNGYCTLDAASSFKTQLNSTSYKLSWRIKLSSSFPSGCVDIVDADVYSETDHTSNSEADLFYFMIYTGWWNDDWQKRTPIIISENSGSTLTDHQIAINVTYDSDMQSDFDDLRFTWLNQTLETEVLCDAWLEIKNDEAWAYVWIEVPEIPASDSALLFMYYNNSAASSCWNGTATFILFDDFDDGIIDTNKWSVVKEGSANSVVEETRGMLHLAGEPNVISSGNLKSVNAVLTNGFMIELKHKIDDEHYADVSFGSGSLQTEDGGTSWFHTTLGNGYLFMWQSPVSGESSNDIAIKKAPEGAATTLLAGKDTGSLTTLNEWHTLKIIYKEDGTLKWYHDGALWLSVTDTTYLNDAKYLLLSQGEYSTGCGGNRYIDWIIVRKYVASEPSYSIGSEETCAAANAPMIDEFQAPSIVYANKYFWLNVTVSDADGVANLDYVTIRIGTIVLKWDSSGDVFSEQSDPSGLCTLDTAASTKTQLSSTSYKLSFRLKLSWSFTDGSVDVSATAYDVSAASGSDSQAGLFTFEDDVVVQGCYFSMESEITVKGHVYYEGTSIAPTSGVTVKAEYGGSVKASTSSLTNRLFTLTWTESSSGLRNYTIYAVTDEPSVQNQTLQAFSFLVDSQFRWGFSNDTISSAVWDDTQDRLNVTFSSPANSTLYVYGRPTYILGEDFDLSTAYSGGWTRLDLNQTTSVVSAHPNWGDFYVHKLTAGEVTDAYWTNQLFTLELNGTSGTSARLEIYCGSRGMPKSWSGFTGEVEYDADIMILSGTVTYQSPVTVTLDYTIPTSSGSSAAGGGGSSSTGGFSILPKITLSIAPVELIQIHPGETVTGMLTVNFTGVNNIRVLSLEFSGAAADWITLAEPLPKTIFKPIGEEVGTGEIELRIIAPENAEPGDYTVPVVVKAEVVGSQIQANGYLTFSITPQAPPASLVPEYMTWIFAGALIIIVLYSYLKD